MALLQWLVSTAVAVGCERFYSELDILYKTQKLFLTCWPNVVKGFLAYTEPIQESYRDDRNYKIACCHAMVIVKCRLSAHA
jgi:hypothetical protein